MFMRFTGKTIGTELAGTALLILSDVLESYELHELREMTWTQFWNQIDVQNAYEEDWKANRAYYKPYYQITFNEIKRFWTK
jgi:hypothetical protein